LSRHPCEYTWGKGAHPETQPPRGGRDKSVCVEEKGTIRTLGSQKGEKKEEEGTEEWESAPPEKEHKVPAVLGPDTPTKGKVRSIAGVKYKRTGKVYQVGCLIKKEGKGLFFICAASNKFSRGRDCNGNTSEVIKRAVLS